MKIPQAWMARENAVLLVNAYLDGELDAAASLQVEQLIADDASLKAEHDRLLSLRLALATHRPDDRASEALRNRVAAIGEGPVAADLPTKARFNWRQMAASVAFAACLGSAATYLALTHDFTSADLTAIVAGHEHALLAPEPFEVASNDTHTVKPWFDAHVALSPQVFDLTEAGFPLIGGRLDEIDGKPMPVQVFRRRAHVISLMAIPAPGSNDTGAPATSNSRDGYLVLSWNGLDFKYSAVADLPVDELTTFVSAWRRQSRELP